MGCDIHMYVEYRNSDHRENYWSSFGGRINPGRNYALFGHLAGVRDDVAPVVDPRGVPSNLGFWAADDWWLGVSDEIEGEDYVSSADAQRYAGYGKKIDERDGKPFRVEHPDWHTPSWVTPTEFQTALDLTSKQWNPGDAYYALLAAAKEFERRGNEVRIVFWFDN